MLITSDLDLDVLMQGVRVHLDEQVRAKDCELNQLKSVKLDLDKDLRDCRSAIERVRLQFVNLYVLFHLKAVFVLALYTYDREICWIKRISLFCFAVTLMVVVCAVAFFRQCAQFYSLAA
jgi:hypothetical protein